MVVGAVGCPKIRDEKDERDIKDLYLGTDDRLVMTVALFFGRPADGLGDESAVGWVEVGVGAVSELDEADV